jgi:uncharacterized CHY-type Zn-finger protein
MKNASVQVKGRVVDDQTRCVHYHSPLDVIALKFACCGQYYPCFYCHEEEAGHEPRRWRPDQFETRAVLCGVCRGELSIREYFAAGYACPFCAAAFNPGCRNHNHLYFET